MNTIPRHIGIILDGNRRWARQHMLEIAAGHAQGIDNLNRILRQCTTRGVPHLTVYGFSTENWQRTDEVPHLMRIFEAYARNQQSELVSQGVRVRVAGQFGRLPAAVQQALTALVQATAMNTQLTLTLCLSYGGRDEIVRAAQAAVAAGETLTESAITDYLDTRGMPDPDLIIRTGGEQRLSNFLTWQSTYSELYFTDTLWPDFDESELDRAIAWYGARDRRQGT